MGYIQSRMSRQVLQSNLHLYLPFTSDSEFIAGLVPPRTFTGRLRNKGGGGSVTELSQLLLGSSKVIQYSHQAYRRNFQETGSLAQPNIYRYINQRLKLNLGLKLLTALSHPAILCTPEKSEIRLLLQELSWGGGGQAATSLPVLKLTLLLLGICKIDPDLWSISKDISPPPPLILYRSSRFL